MLFPRNWVLSIVIAIAALFVFYFFFLQPPASFSPTVTAPSSPVTSRAIPSTPYASLAPTPALAPIVTTAPSPIAASSATSAQGKYIMAFLACDTASNSCNNPANHMTYLVESNDGLAWIPVPGFKPYAGSPPLSASVPDVLKRNDTFYVYNPNGLTRYNIVTGVQTPEEKVTLKNQDGSVAPAGFVDPSLIMDSHGHFVLFYLPGIFGQDPARCQQGQSSCSKQIMSATEETGSDGSVFVIDGVRADLAISGNFATASDPAVFEGPDGYYLYVSEGQSVVALFSPSLEGNYDYVPGLPQGVLVPQGIGGVPAGYYDKTTGQFWTWVTGGFSTQSIALAKTSRLDSPIPSSSFTPILSGCNSGLGCSYTIESPGFHAIG